MSQLGFRPLYYADRLRTVRADGDVGIITLWTPPAAAARKLQQAVPDIFDAGRSRVAVVANLYGDGMYAMLCNLLFNPQIRHLVAIGEDLGLATCHELEAFLNRGLESTVLFGRPMMRIAGTERVLPVSEDFDADQLRSRITFRYLGKFAGPGALEELEGHLSSLPPAPECTEEQRVRVDIASPLESDYAYQPSETSAHQVVRAAPLACWQELVVRVVRFGRPVESETRPRLELLAVKAVITRPEPDPADVLADHGFSLEGFQAYQQAIFRPVLPADISYTYGNRLRGYFGRAPDLASASSANSSDSDRTESSTEADPDSLASVIRLLRDNPGTRRGYISLWDTSADLIASAQGERRDVPCLATLFFRMSEGRLTLSATYRAHNLLTAWLENVYGLMAIQQHIATATGVPSGSITVLSHSLGIDPRSPRFELALSIERNWAHDEDVDRETGRHELRRDPQGYFEVSVDTERRLIIADHRAAGVLIKRYTGDRAERIERAVSADLAVSLISHALWLGRELKAKEYQLRRMTDD